MAATLTPKDALIIVDVQNDFMPGGSLPVPDGHAVVPVINRWIDAASRGGARVVASRDWHPAGHSSFREQGGPWPAHCVQGTPGAAFHPDLRLPGHTHLISKGDRPELDQYSDFESTPLAGELRAWGVTRVFVCGLAQDVCVLATALGALENGFETRVITAGTRPLGPESGEKALREMVQAGAVLEEETP
jgi:nicotinamidase/pyrazinamidase